MTENSNIQVLLMTAILIQFSGKRVQRILYAASIFPHED